MENEETWIMQQQASDSFTRCKIALQLLIEPFERILSTSDHKKRVTRNSGSVH
jgi:hypothetical protein